MKGRCPMSARDVLDRQFLENRARLLEIAAFLDRIDRCDDAEVARRDARYRAFHQAFADLTAAGARTDAVLQALSDPTTEPLESAEGLKGAAGAWEGSAR